MMKNSVENKQLTAIISKFFNIESSVIGDTEDNFKIRFIGHLIEKDAEKGFKKITEALNVTCPHNMYQFV